MDSTALHDLFRSEMRDEATPYLWSDAEIYSYIDDAQKMFCRLQGGIADASSAVTRLSVTAGDVFVPVSPLILKIREARRSADGYDLEILNFEDMQSRRSVDDYGYRSGYRIDNTVGIVKAIVVGMEANKIRLVHIPQEDQLIDLIVYRMPLVSITAGGQALEIDEHHHRHLLHWMKHLAYQKQDAETYDRGRSDMFRAEFLAYCDQAKAEREKREHKYRTVVYGGY
ncbi:MAG: hypothetical protein KatS3mg015_2621 [Fimbriimonadales bacterium]|nr:MAG: hypothetical protein KatS3mg015_2621 [Fimbriimonadales bacterium]